MRTIKKKIIFVLVIMLMITIFSVNNAISTTANSPPNKPDLESPVSVTIHEQFYIQVSTTDPNGDDVRYGVAWDGDADDLEWTDYYPSGVEVSIPHTYHDYTDTQIGVKAEDTLGAQSEMKWNDISCPRVHSSQYQQSGSQSYSSEEESASQQEQSNS